MYFTEAFQCRNMPENHYVSARQTYNVVVTDRQTDRQTDGIGIVSISWGDPLCGTLVGTAMRIAIRCRRCDNLCSRTYQLARPRLGASSGRRSAFCNRPMFCFVRDLCDIGMGTGAPVWNVRPIDPFMLGRLVVSYVPYSNNNLIGRTTCSLVHGDISTDFWSRSTTIHSPWLWYRSAARLLFVRVHTNRSTGLECPT